MISESKRQALTQRIKQQAVRLGFDDCGVAEAGFLEREAPRFEAWLTANAHGSMAYMENHFDKRLDPRELVPGARSVISLIKHYYPPAGAQQAEGAPKIARYAWGKDYHKVLKPRLYQLLEFIREEAGEVNGRAFVDSAPVMDKAWAARAGMGWQGKNTNLLRKGEGSYFLIAELVIDLPLAYNTPVTDHCGSCRQCIDACPTQALAPYQIDASRCLAHLTIELKAAMPKEFADQTEGWAFGCDICQEVCPWNRFAQAHNEPEFRPLDPILNNTYDDWARYTGNQFKKLLRDSPLSRVTYKKWLNNLHASLGRSFAQMADQPTHFDH